MKEQILKTNNLTEFIQIVEDWMNRWQIGESAIYRGHTDFNWILIAKLFRDPEAKSENKTGDSPKQIEEQLLSEHLKKNDAHKLEDRLFREFSRYLYAYRPDLVSTSSEEEISNTRAMHEWRQLALAQHYGLPTRFLDFTTNMLVALFFAVEGPAARRKTTKGDEKEQDSAVWCIDASNRRKVWQVLKNADDIWLPPLEFAKQGGNPKIEKFFNTAFIPEHFDGRIRAQGSVFMCEPRGKKPNFTLHNKLCDKGQTLRICIPCDTRESLLEQLDHMGINRSNLFPDLESAARYLAWAIYQRKRL